MADAADSRCQSISSVEEFRGSKRGYVTLAQRNDKPSSSNDDDDAVVVGVRVSRKVVRRSGLLAGIKDTEGLASLPAGLCPQDVKLWETACTFNIETRVDELVTILQVADALGDPNDQKWVDDLAEKASATDWKSETPADTMLAALLRLPPHLLRRVLSACLHRPPPRFSVPTTPLETFPAPLHIAIVSAMMSASTLAVPAATASTILSLLPYATTPSTGLHTLTVHHEPHQRNSMSASKGVLLARAVSAHPTLTALHLDRQPPQLLRTFSSCLAPATLPALVALRISTRAHPGGCAEAAACLALLPTLTTLTVTFSLNHPYDSSPMAESLAAYARLAGGPATLPRLDRLDFFEAADRPIDTRQCGGCAHAFLQLITTPALTRLALKVCPVRTPFSAVLPEVTSERFPSLHTLALSGALKADVLTSMKRLSIDGVSFPPVRTVMVESACPASVRRIAAAACQCFAPTLTQLRMTLNSEVTGPHDDTCTVRMARDSWPPFWGVLGGCTHLRALDLVCLSTPFHGHGVSFSRSLAQALERLTRLTGLKLSCGLGPAPADGAPVVLSGSAIGGALAALADLRELSIHSRAGVLRFEDTGAQPVLDACTGLKALADLELCFHGVMFRWVRELLPKMAALSVLVLRGSVAEEDPDGFNALEAHFPGEVVLE